MTNLSLYSAIIGAFSALLILFVKEYLERAKTSRMAIMLLKWLCKNLKESITHQVVSAPLIDIAILKPYITEIASNEDLSTIFDSTHAIFISWKAGLFEYKDINDQPVRNCVDVLDRNITTLAALL